MGGLVSTLTVRLEDDVSGKAGKAAASLKNLGAAGNDLKKLAAINPQIGKLTKQLDALHGQAGKITAFKQATRDLGSTSLAFRASRQEVTRLTAELDKARTKAEALKGIKGEAEARKAAEADVRRLTRELRNANTAATESRAAFMEQGRAARALRADLAAAGVPIKQLAAHERDLAQRIEHTTAALKRQKQIATATLAQQAGRGGGHPADAGPRGGGINPFFGRRDREARRRAERHGGAGGAGLDALGIGLGGYGAVQSYKNAAAFDRRMTMIGQTAEASRSEIDGLAASVHNLAQETATPVDKLAGGLEALVAQGRNLKEAREFLPSVARTAAASGAEVDDIAKSADSVATNFKISGKEMQRAFDIMAAGGKAGQFELKDMARFLPSIGSAAGAAGFKGEKGLSDLVAMLQTVRKGTGTAEEAAASMVNIFTKMESEETTNKFKKFGVDLRKEMDNARKNGANLVETFEGLVQKATKGDLSKIPQLIADQEFGRGVRALMTYRNEWQKLSSSLQSGAPGTVAKDLGRVTSDSQASVDRISNTITRFTQALASVSDATGLTGRLSGMAGELEAVAKGIEHVNSAYQRGGVKEVVNQLANDTKEFIDNKRKETVEQRRKDQAKLVDEIEQDYVNSRRTMEKTGRPPAQINAVLRSKRQAMLDQKKALRDLDREANPPAIAPSSPASASTAGVPSLIDKPYKDRPARPFPQQGTPIPEHAKTRPVPLPPARPPEFGGVVQQLDEAKQKADALNATTIAPRADGSGLAPLNTAADEATQRLTQLGSTSVSPTVNAGSITAATAAVDVLLSKLAQVGAAAAGAQAKVAALNSSVASVNAVSASAGASSGRVRQAVQNNHTNTA